MSEITDFYLSWDATSVFGGNASAIRRQEPIPFVPTDLSGCALWLNANNNDAVVYNDLLFVSSWSNQGYLGGQFDISGNALVIYGSTIINGLNTVSFTSNAFMSGNFAFDFQPRSLFFVTKENTNLGSNTVNPWLTSDINGGLEAFSLANGVQTYFLGKHPSPIPELAFETSNVYIGTPALVEFINGTDLSDNWGGVNGVKYPFVFDAVASNYNTSNIPYFLGGYFGGAPVPSDQDVCEIIMYNRALADPERIEVEKYLREKWNLQEPPPLPPSPFSPDDIAGLYIWMDGNNSNTWSIDGASNVLTWSNLGLASNVFSAGASNVTLVVNSNTSNYEMFFNTEATLTTTAALPYYSRTSLVAFEILSDLTLINYPYTNFITTSATAGLQMGLAYDSGGGTYVQNICQAGINCPILTGFSNFSTGTNLAVYIVDSNNASNNAAYYCGGSNINTSSDLGNLFEQTAISYLMGSPVFDSPIFVMKEILEYDTILSTENLSTVANYLVTKWAISSFVPIS